MSDFDDQFNLRKRHPISRYHLLLNVFQSLLARQLMDCSLDISYGDSAGQSLDIFPAKPDRAPVFVFIHGGYFRALDKSQYRYTAFPMAKAGYTTVLVNYDLAPKVRVADIVEQVLAAFEWIRENIHKWHGNPDDIVLCGHSVGAFLAAKILEKDWPGGSGVMKAALLSGLYDLGPMKRSYLDRELRLTDEDVATLSPQTGTLLERPELLVAVGERESEVFTNQSIAYSRKLSEAGIRNELLVVPGIDHYTMSRLLSRRNSVIVDWMTRSEPAVAAGTPSV
ncbi:alpha/beta hydrolase [Nitratireductor sp. XY-223]|uniref:alpha/beta hydrolase n=1 Tax=Nitratireductor sp. XY-223 TaxID=2561926 RepID=UPI0010AABEA5|nr:alpha/beta hydrolase [Nitratireductor sp. XY-223]